MDFLAGSGEQLLDATGWLGAAVINVPAKLDLLPDGQRGVVIGDVLGYAAFNHLQGDNPGHYCGDCGLVCCAEILNQFGIALTEADVVRHARRFRELHVVPGHPEQSGWTLPSEQARILTEYGVPSRAEQDQPIARLGAAVQLGHGVIAAVNAGVLWSDPHFLDRGAANHVVTVTGIARDPCDGALVGFYINDSGNGKSALFVSAHLMTTAYARTGGFCVVTDGTYKERAAALTTGRGARGRAS